jgi:uncharacterized protein YbjT (DUF2867 family)
MAAKKIIAVVGATGAQGGGLVRAILGDPKSEFAVRAIVRDVNTNKAKELKKLGAEVVTGNIDDRAGLVKAFRGAYGAYCVTFFYEHFSPERELAEARNMAEATKEAGVKHVIWSTLEDTRKFIPLSDNRMPTLQGKYKVPHFDAKGEANKIFQQVGVPTTFLLTSFYWDNFINPGMGPEKDQSGALEITLPLGDKKLPSIAADDIGRCAFTIFRNSKEYIGKTVGIAGEHLTGAQIADAFTKALGQKVQYHGVDPDTYRHLGFKGADDLGNMFQFNRDFEEMYCKARSIDFTRRLNPSLQTFDRWLAKHKDQIPLK